MNPLVTVVVPSLNQGRYLNDALTSIFSQDVPVEVYVMDGGSTDDSIAVIESWASKLSGWRAYKDDGQAAAINEGIARGRAPFVCWLNSDDFLLPGGLFELVSVLRKFPEEVLVYGKSWNFLQETGKKNSVWVEPFEPRRLAVRCIISQPATLIRRSAWDAVGGLDSRLHMAMDYDLWWRMHKKFGRLCYLEKYVAVNRDHGETKTRTKRRCHYKEAISVVRRHYGSVPMKWWFAYPYSVWFKSMLSRFL